MKLWMQRESPRHDALACRTIRRPIRAGARASFGAGVVAAIVLALVAPVAQAVGPRADSKPEVLVLPKGRAPLVLPEMPSLKLVSALRHSPQQGWFGIGLRCSDCTISIEDSSQARVWDFEEPPEIQYVDPDGPAGKAGLRRGDVLTHVDGSPITTAEGGRRFGAAKPGEKVRWTYERDGKTFIAALTAEEHPDRPWLDLATSEELQETLAKIREQRERIVEEKRVIGADRLAERSYENSVRLMLEAQRSLERAQESLQRRGYLIAPDAPVALLTPEPQKLRYEGTIGGSEVEVHGTGSIIVREDERGGEELLITTPDATIRIRTKK